MQATTIEKLANFFWQLEEDFNLLDYEIEKIKVWQYQRFRIFIELSLAVGLYKQGHTKKKGIKDIIIASPSLLYYSLFSNPLIGNYRKSILIFNSGRKVNVEGKLIDIYTKHFVEEENIQDYEIIEELYENIHLTHERKNRKHQDYQQIRTIFLSSISRFKFTEEQIHFIQKVKNKIDKELGIDFNLFRLLKLAYLYFKYDYEFYVKLLKKRNPNKIFIICSYTYKKALIAAAKSLNVESIEIQHGTMNKYHMGYSYPNHDKVSYFPDKFYVFGTFWKEHIKLPLKKEDIIVKGFPYFNAVREKYIHLNKSKNQITILSQGPIGMKLNQLFAKDAHLFKSFNIKYKLHPGEYARWKDDYQELLEFSSKSNIDVIDTNDTNLYYYLNQSEYVIGVFSTAIYEALALGCKVILINLPGIEYMTELIRNNYVGFANNFNEAYIQIQNRNFKTFPVDYFFKQTETK